MWKAMPYMPYIPEILYDTISLVAWDMVDRLLDIVL